MFEPENHNMPWTSTADVELRKLWDNQSIPAGEIARLLNRSYHSVLYRANYLGLDRRRGGASYRGSAFSYRITLPKVKGIENDKYNYKEYEHETQGSDAVLEKLRQRRQNRQIRSSRASGT